MVIKSVICGLSSLRKQAEKERRKKVEVSRGMGYSSQWGRRIFGWQKIDHRHVIHFWKGIEKCYSDSLKSKSGIEGI